MTQEKVAIVTDSTADIPEDLLEQYQIHVINNIIVIDGKDYTDGVDITRTDFYRRLPGMKSIPTTATASSGIYQTLYEKLFNQNFSQVLSIHASGKLSGIINAASVAAQAFNNRVHVIDSQYVTLGLGFQVLAAAEALQRGQPLAGIIKMLDEFRQRVRVIAMLDTLEYVRRSGRVAWVRARLGELLNIKPLLEIKNGEVLSLGEARTYQKGIARLLEIIKEFGPLERLAILHTNAELQAKKLIDRLDIQLPKPPMVVNVTTVIGSHVGPNGLGIAAVVKY